MVVAEGGGGGVEEAGEGVDQGAGLVEVLVVGEVFGQAEVDGGGAHQVEGGGRDDLHAGYVGDVARHCGQRVRAAVVRGRRLSVVRLRSGT